MTNQAEPVEVTGEEFHEWTSDKVTKLVLQEIEEYRGYLTQLLVSGGTLGANPDKSTERAVGELAGLTQLYLFFSDASATKKVSNYGH